MLHVISRSASRLDTQALLRTVNERDAVLFVQNGVSNLMSDTSFLSALKKSGACLYALRDDVEARGMQSLIVSDATMIDYSQYVDLTVEHTPQMLW